MCPSRVFSLGQHYTEFGLGTIREAGASWGIMGKEFSLPLPLNSSVPYFVFWCTGGLRGPLNCAHMMPRGASFVVEFPQADRLTDLFQNGFLFLPNFLFRSPTLFFMNFDVLSNQNKYGSDQNQAIQNVFLFCETLYLFLFPIPPLLFLYFSSSFSRQLSRKRLMWCRLRTQFLCELDFVITLTSNRIFEQQFQNSFKLDKSK